MPSKISGSKELEIEEQIRLPGHKWQLSCLEFSPNGLFLASGSWDKQVRIWDLSKLETSKILGEDKLSGHQAPVTSLSWIPSIEFFVASTSADKTAILWNADNANKLATFKEHTGWVLGSTFTKSGSHLATCSWDKTIIIWDVATLKIKEKLVGHSRGVWRCKFHSLRNESILCSASEDSSVRLWDVRADSSRAQAVLVGAHDDSVRCCAWSVDGSYIAAGSTDMKISVWDARERRVVTTIQGHEDTVTDLQFLPRAESESSPVLVSAGDTSCRFWDALRSKAKQLQCLRQHKSDFEVECLSVSPDGSLLSSGGRDNDIILSTINIPDISIENLHHEDTTISNGELLWKKASREAFLTSVSDDISSPRGRTMSSTAKIVDNAVQQNELKEQEKNQAAAKQTIKIKSTATNEILQSKLMQLHKPKVQLDKTKAEEHTASSENMELQNQRKKLHHIERSLSESADSGSLRYKSKELESERQKLRNVRSFAGTSSSTAGETSEQDQRKQAAIERKRSTQRSVLAEEDVQVYESLGGSAYAASEGGDSLLYQDIKDITEELIRISDEERMKQMGQDDAVSKDPNGDGEDDEPLMYDARL